MVFELKVKFLHKGSKRIEVESKNKVAAITEAMNQLNLTEKDNISAVLVMSSTK